MLQLWTQCLSLGRSLVRMTAFYALLALLVVGAHATPIHAPFIRTKAPGTIIIPQSTAPKTGGLIIPLTGDQPSNVQPGGPIIPVTGDELSNLQPGGPIIPATGSRQWPVFGKPVSGSFDHSEGGSDDSFNDENIDDFNHDDGYTDTQSDSFYDEDGHRIDHDHLIDTNSNQHGSNSDFINSQHSDQNKHINLNAQDEDGNDVNFNHDFSNQDTASDYGTNELAGQNSYHHENENRVSTDGSSEHRDFTGTADHQHDRTDHGDDTSSDYNNSTSLSYNGVDGSYAHLNADETRQSDTQNRGNTDNSQYSDSHDEHNLIVNPDGTYTQNDINQHNSNYDTNYHNAHDENSYYNKQVSFEFNKPPA